MSTLTFERTEQISIRQTTLAELVTAAERMGVTPALLLDSILRHWLKKAAQ